MELSVLGVRAFARNMPAFFAMDQESAIGFIEGLPGDGEQIFAGRRGGVVGDQLAECVERAAQPFRHIGPFAEKFDGAVADGFGRVGDQQGFGE